MVGLAVASTNWTKLPPATPGCRKLCIAAGIANSTRHTPRTLAPERVNDPLAAVVVTVGGPYTSSNVLASVPVSEMHVAVTVMPP